MDLKCNLRIRFVPGIVSPSAEEGVDLKITIKSCTVAGAGSPSAEEGVDLKGPYFSSKPFRFVVSFRGGRSGFKEYPKKESFKGLLSPSAEEGVDLKSGALWLLQRLSCLLPRRKEWI